MTTFTYTNIEKAKSAKVDYLKKNKDLSDFITTYKNYLNRYSDEQKQKHAEYCSCYGQEVVVSYVLCGERKYNLQNVHRPQLGNQVWIDTAGRFGDIVTIL